MGCWFSGLRKRLRPSPEARSEGLISINPVRVAIPRMRRRASRMSARVINVDLVLLVLPPGEGTTLSQLSEGGGKSTSRWTGSDLQNHRHNQRALLRLPGNIAIQVGADLFLDHAVVSFFFFAGVRQCVFDD